MTFVVSTGGGPAAATGEVQNAIWRIGPELAIYQVTTMDDVVARNTRSIDNLTTLLIGFGLVALVLALGGLYGVMSFTVERRTKEIGLRMALGAQARSILRTVLQRSVLLVVVGLTLGGVIALLLSRTLNEVLFEIEAFDPAAYAATHLSGSLATLVSGFEARPPLAVGDVAVLILLLDGGDLGEGLVEDIALLLRDDHVHHADGNGPLASGCCGNRGTKRDINHPRSFADCVFRPGLGSYRKHPHRYCCQRLVDAGPRWPRAVR